MIDTLFSPLPVQCLAKCDPARTGLAWSVFLSSADLLPAVRLLYQAEYALEDITAIDAREGYLLVYHFDHMDRQGRLALRVLIPHETPEIASIASVFQGAEWHERETTDFYGIVFNGNPNPIPLLLAPEMKFHPLRKEDGARVSLIDMLPVGEVLRSAPGFDLLTPKAAEGGGATGA
ncbi:NADH-quinone oxidoreductase subunit C [Telmatospirillum sp.]|uniref:NADH-quinone oxidoreductase subunit C n=1 Tax=Telmatospirillum sp. TaxID=2079197 RepID=UPI00284F0A89|nr:NADH-quinone oxidoreductase subunit C [Telmatospirillum sp.]MDR3437716.1 NADH-quinone oxidoreductase subunit C [Telmatospirillum sp.]